jgi:BMFP domain-containing protein YqiC
MVSPVSPAKILEELGHKASDLLASGPAKDVEKNVKALLGSAFSKLDLVTRDEFELQREMLAKTREKLEALEQRIAQLDKQSGD